MAKSNPLVALGVPQAAIDAEIRGSAAVRAEKKAVAKKMAAHAKSISPRDQGDYAVAWDVQDNKRGDVRVVNDNFKAHWIEDGTGGSSPTPEFAVAAQTAIAFGGNAGDVVYRTNR